VTLTSLSGNELGAGLFLSFWLLFGAGGSFVFLSLERKARGRAVAVSGAAVRGALAFPRLLLALGVVVPANCYWIVLARRLFFGTAFSLSLGQTLLLAACAAFPASSLIGALFGAAVAASDSEPRARADIATRAPVGLYLAEAVGSCVGGLMASLVLAPFLSTLEIALCAAVVVLLVGAMISRLAKAGIRTVAACAACCASAVLVLGVPPLRSAAETALARARFPGADVIMSADSRTQNFAALRVRESISFYQNGVLSFFSQAGEREEEIAHIALLSRPMTRNVLLVGSGWPFLPREILKHPVASLDLVVQDSIVHRIGLGLLPSAFAGFLSDARLHLAYGDPGAVLRAGAGRYDVAFIDAGLPDTLLAARAYTRQFFRQVQAHLEDGGWVVVSAPSVPSSLSPALLSLNASLLSTLKDTFGSAIAIPGEYAGNIFIAGAGVRADSFVASRLAAALQSRGIKTKWITPGSLATILNAQKVEELNARIGNAAGAPNTMEHPILLTFSLAYREELAAGSAALDVLQQIGVPQVAAGLLAVALLLVLAQRFLRRRILLPGCAAAAGFSGMIAELSLLCAFQLVWGYLYGSIAALVGVFMAGLAAGSWLAFTFFVPAGVAAGRRYLTLLLLAAGGGATLVALLTPILLGASPPAFAIFLGVAMILAGCGSGATAALALSFRGTSGTRPESLYGADLLGGAIGGILAGSLFIPIAGVTRSLWFAVMGYAFAMILVIGTWTKAREA
jgi:spermidine synthase